jgi:hypothetical protein
VSLSTVLMDTVLSRLALLFLAAAQGDLMQARAAASQLLASYHPETEDELRLAAQIVSFSLHALEALSQATTRDMPLTRILRLRGSAVSLSRESHKAQRRLDQLQQARLTGTPAPQAATQPAPKTEKALNLIAETRDILAETAPKGQTWTQAYQQRQRAKRISENLRKNQATQQHVTAT